MTQGCHGKHQSSRAEIRSRSREHTKLDRAGYDRTSLVVSNTGALGFAVVRRVFFAFTKRNIELPGTHASNDNSNHRYCLSL